MVGRDQKKASDCPETQAEPLQSGGCYGVVVSDGAGMLRGITVLFRGDTGIQAG